MRPIQVKQLDYDLTPTAGLALVGHLLKTLAPTLADVDGSWAVNALHETIKEFNNQSRDQTAQMLKLTKAMAWLTGVMLLGLLVALLNFKWVAGREG